MDSFSIAQVALLGTKLIILKIFFSSKRAIYHLLHLLERANTHPHAPWIPQPTEIPQRVLSSELSTPQSILIEDLVLFLISWSLEIFSFVSYTWHLPAPSEIERVGMSKGQGFWSQWGPGAMFFTEHIFLSLPSVLRGDLEHSLFPVNVGEKCYKTPSANHQVRNIDS